MTFGTGLQAGFIAAILSTLLSPFVAWFFKESITATDAANAVFWRFLFGLVLLYPVMRRRSIHSVIRSGFPALAITRALFCALAVATYFYSLSGLPIGIALMLGCMGPLFVPIVSPFMIKEKTTLWTLAMVMCGAFGAFIIAFDSASLDMTLSGEHIPYLLAGIVSSLLSAMIVVFSKKMAQKDSKESLLFGFLIGGFFVSLLWAFYTGFAVPDPWFILCISAASLLANLQQMLLVIKVRELKIIYSAVLQYLPVPAGLIAGYFFYDEYLGLDQFAGVLIIFLSAGYLSVRGAREEGLAQTK